MTTHSDSTRDELLLETLMDLVPDSAMLATVIDIHPRIFAMLEGYGTLLNVLQAATENQGTLTDRLYAGYYELTNKGE